MDKITVDTFEQIPNEVYQFNYNKEELDEIHRLRIKSICKKPLIAGVINVLLLIYSLNTPSGVAVTSFISAFLLLNLISTIRTILSYNKMWKSVAERISQSTYEYKIHESYININIYRNGEKTRDSKHYFTDIENILNYDKWLFLIIGGQSYFLRKCDLNEYSKLNAFMYTHPQKTKTIVSADRWIFLSVILFIASLLSILGALMLIGTVSNANGLFVENTWLFFVMTPIPVSSVILGFILKSKGYKYKKNIIIGLIMTFILCIYGSFAFIF